MPGEDNPTDLFTKNLNTATFEKHASTYVDKVIPQNGLEPEEDPEKDGSLKAEVRDKVSATMVSG